VRWRLDPKTGAFKEYRTKTPDSGPHGLAADKDGNIWFAASFQGYIGKLDPKTGTFTECWREQSNRRGLLPYTIIMGIRGAAEEYPADRHLLPSSNTFSRRG
jgi:streptogramin lyase